jgi:hypothetical protein
VVLEKREAAAGFFRMLGNLLGLAAVLILGWFFWTQF